MTIRAVVVDDEELGRRGIVSRLARRNDVTVVAECANGEDAVEAVRLHSPELLFLDVQMPGMGGFDVLQQLPATAQPRVIFVTAWSAHAIRAFEVHALDYLLKPIDDDRFCESLERALSTINSERDAAVYRRVAALVTSAAAPTPPPVKAPERYAVKTKGRTVLVRHADIDWVGAEGDYVRIHAGSKTWLVRETLGTVERDLGTRRFVRIHRSTVVNIERVAELRSFENGDCAVLLRDGTELRLSRTYREALARLA